MIAFISFGRQEPPYPGPALRNKFPILGSSPIAFAISSIFASDTFSQILAN